MLWQGFPSGADIGLHNSVIYSITQSGNTNFLYNYFHMGGGISLTFPGYHIFTAMIISITGLSEYIAQALVVAMFSSLFVLASYLVTRAAWTESGALIVAVLVSISRFDIEMTLWGGYPNVVTLFLIPLTFYLYLQRTRFSLAPFIASTSILVGSIFLTHSLSTVIFLTIIVATVLFVLFSPSFFGTSRKSVFYWLLPIFLGSLLVAPFLFQAAQAYFSSNATLNPSLDIKSAILSTKIIPIAIVIPLFLIVGLFFPLSKEYKGRYFSLPTLLFFIWLLVPLVLTQGYLFGLIIDYNRFLYFLLLPVLVLFGMFVDHGSIVLSRIIENYRNFTSRLQDKAKDTNKYVAKLSRKLSQRNLYVVLVAGILAACFFLIPLFVNPSQGLAVGVFYQVMDNSGYEGIQWLKNNALENSVFVSDALYGWWLGGFSQHRTISAVPPEYLSGVQELNPARNTSLLLDTDYMIDNGLIQVREDGGYIVRHNPEILTKLNWTYYPYSFLNFQSDQIRIDFTNNGTADYRYANNLTVVNMYMQVAPNNESATIIVSRSSDLLNYTQFTTVYEDSKFVNITATVDSNVRGISLNYLTYQVESKGIPIAATSKTIAWIDEGVKALGQLIFVGVLPQVRRTIDNPPPFNFDLQYVFGGASEGKIEFAATTYSVTDNPDVYENQKTIYNYFSPIIESNLNLPNQPSNIPITTFNYQEAMQYYNISYVANCIFDINPKFADDPTFSLVFINDKVAIFKVEANANLAGR